MSSRTPLALVAFLLLPLPLPLAFAEPGALGPDSEGAWLLAFDVTRAEAGQAVASLDVLREDTEGTRAATRNVGTLQLPAGTSRQEISFLPAEGSGRYLVGLVVDGARVGEVAFDVEGAGASQEIGFEIPDSPTYLNLTSDDVNAAGKLKAPGDALLTRALLSDGNGMADLDGVRWSIERAGAPVETGALPIAAAPNATSAPLELRYDRAPLAAGAYTLRLAAQKGGVAVAEAARTFAIREVAPTFVSGVIPNVTPDEERLIETTFVLADRNGAVGPGALEARAYRGSSRAEGAGVLATLGAPMRLPDADGAARWAYPLAVRVPAGAAPGLLRVSLYSNDSLLAALPFEVRALPQLRGVVASVEAGGLVLMPNASGVGVLTARLSDGGAASVSVTSADLSAPLRLDPPRRGATLRWSVELRAREGGPILAERNGSWTAPFNGPEVRAAPVHVRSRLPAVWALDAAGWDVGAATVNTTFVRWDGAPESALRASVSNGRVRVDAPRDLTAGRYTAQALLTWPNGSASEATWSFDAGPWIELSLGAAIVEGTTARVPLENAGGLSVARLVVEASPAARVGFRVGNETFTARVSGERSVFSGFHLAPGEKGELQVELPPGPHPAGRASVALRVLARVEVG